MAAVVGAALLALGGCGSAGQVAEAAAGGACAIPADLAPVPAKAPAADEVNPAPATGLMLALSWSPEFCRANADDPEDKAQCSGRFGWVVHGLWPDRAGRDDPRFCKPVGSIDAATLKRHFCMMPSAALMQHQWAAHGSCGWDSPAAYLAATEAQWRKVKLPDVEALPRQGTTVGDLRAMVAAANPAIPREAMFVALSRRGWLRELRLCADRAGRWQACPDGRVGAPDGVPLRVWRRQAP